MGIYTNVIYQIANLVNNKRYIGSALIFKRRKSQHLSDLRKNRHENPHLQNSWNKHGEDNFVFEIIDRVYYAEELIYREDYWADKYNFYKELYNIRKISESNLGLRWSQEHKDKISEALKGENSFNYGKPMPQATKDKISKAQRGEKHWNYGGTLKHKEKLIEVNSKPVAQLDKDTNKIIATFNSIRQAADFTGISRRKIGDLCNKRGQRNKNGKIYYHKTAGGYKWEFIAEESPNKQH